jgi:molecular chaperone HscC
MSRMIGIDLGTTNSAAAYLSDDGPKIIPNALGEALTPSVVGIDRDGKLLVGRAARELQVIEPKRCASVFKRFMGTDWTVKLDGRQFRPEELSSLVLRTLKEDAEAYFKAPVTRAVITVPAYFNDQQRKATLSAGRIAGFEVERIFNEPTAAALAYGFHESREDKTLLIFDLGGGTFDVSVVEIFAGALEVKASSGETFLGGEDFTRTLAARVLESQGLNFERAEMETPERVSRLMQLCELAKRKLSRGESHTIPCPDAKGHLPENGPTATVTRAQFQAWTSAILARVELPLRRVLGDARLSRKAIDEVILVGGATRMPAVVDQVGKLFGKPPHCRLNPDEVVALGAAVQAGLYASDHNVEDLVVTDVAPFTLGIEISKRFGSEFRGGYYMPILHRNTTIPTSRSEIVSTLSPNQTAIDVKVYQGESRKTEENLLLGEFQVPGIPPGPAGQQVEICFTYDLNGVIEVEATIVATRKKVSHLITRYARGLSQRQIDQAVRDMAKLKSHPRDEAVNRTLLKRAERVFKELPGDLREQLGLLLDGFEHSMSQRNQEAVASHRSAIEQFLSAFAQDDLTEQEDE